MRTGSGRGLKLPADAAPPVPDVRACDREPIRIPASIQPHGHLLVLDAPGMALVQASERAGEVLKLPLPQAFGRPVGDVLALDPLPAGFGERLGADRPDDAPGPVLMGLTAGPDGRRYQMLLHRTQASVLLELEELPQSGIETLEHLYLGLREALARMQSADTVEALAMAAAREVRRLTGFDRVMIYRFDENWHGQVVAEDRNERLPSYLGLHFPASDIPSQARELYTLNRLRLIPDAGYVPVPVVPPLHPRTKRPLDMGFAVLRSVSPVHVEYMRNMGTAASMSVSLVHEGRLWGLISCHHAEPARVSHAVRLACDLVGQVMTIQLAAADQRAKAEHLGRLQAVHQRLLAAMASSPDFASGLMRHRDDLMMLTGAQGVAVVTRDTCLLAGRTPSEEQVHRLAEWLSGRGDDEVFATNELPAILPEAVRFKDAASGLLAVSVSKLHPSFVLWFRPEMVHTVSWGGDPRKPVGDEEGMRLHPRRSFEAWKETVRDTALQWQAAEIDAARNLRSAIVGIVLRKAEEMAELTRELERSNKELEAFSYSVSHDLRAPFRHIVGYSELLKETETGRISEKGRRFIETIIESAVTAGRLVDSLLGFSQMGRTTLHPIDVDMNAMVEDARKALAPDLEGRRIAWRRERLPVVRGDPLMLRQAVTNLLSNAVKYTRIREEAVIEVGCTETEAEWIFVVRDNGTGFDMAYCGKLFGVFQRLHRTEDFEGIGIGLANVRRIIERHGGRTWAEGAVDQGAAFYFSLPRAAERS
jgi:two-component system, chemotaxis family, sensor kinase Cph1